MKNFSIDYYNETVQDDIYSLPDAMAAEYVVLTDRMINEGPNLGMPHTKPMKDGLFELRIKSRDGIARVFFCTVINKKIVMLHCFIKKTQQTPQRELDLAKKRMKAYKKEL